MTSRNLPAQAESTSFAYSLFKVLSILMVVTGHWFSQSSIPLWVPTDIGLFIFAFSSGMFTTRIYGIDLDVRAFWRKKLQRLLVRYWLILACLSLLLLACGEPVFHWHSLVHYFGLSGLLNLFGHNQSALGNGLWFFTLLLLFYISYPYLARMVATAGESLLLPLAFAIVLVLLDRFVYIGFALWLTTLGFIVGVYVGRYDTQVPSSVSLSVTVAALAAMLALNLMLGYKGLTGVLLALACIGTNLWLMKVRIPQSLPLRLLASLEDCLLEIYLIHTYLFMHLTGHGALDFVVSLTVIVAAAWALNRAATSLIKHLFAKRKPASSAPGFNNLAAIELGLQEGVDGQSAG
ncbi:acyltransferase family protein [Massilia sp. 9096]|uniref:acyltransferase family protein n=1 Tax=Massilia sp. 9096 TaxID=1500894 RepID=UPI00055E02F0|nr:acyltransferase family protein [Massilia sp. 9096]